MIFFLFVSGCPHSVRIVSTRKPRPVDVNQRTELMVHSMASMDFIDRHADKRGKHFLFGSISMEDF